MKNECCQGEIWDPNPDPHEIVIQARESLSFAASGRHQAATQMFQFLFEQVEKPCWLRANL